MAAQQSVFPGIPGNNRLAGDRSWAGALPGIFAVRCFFPLGCHLALFGNFAFKWIGDSGIRQHAPPGCPRVATMIDHFEIQGLVLYRLKVTAEKHFGRSNTAPLSQLHEGPLSPPYKGRSHTECMSRTDLQYYCKC